MTTAIVLAGGLGTRLRAAVPELPKPMAPVAGEPFLAHLLRYWIGQGVDRFVLSVGYRADAIRAFFGRHWAGAAIDYAAEDEPLGTGGAVRLAAKHLPSDERFLLLNGDTFFAVELRVLKLFAETHDADWCFSLFRQHDDSRYLGIELGLTGRITDLHGGGVKQPHANGGVYLVHPRSLAGTAGPKRGETLSLEAVLFPRFFAQGQRFFGLPCPGRFIDIGVPDDWRRAAEVIVPTRPQEAAHA